MKRFLLLVLVLIALDLVLARFDAIQCEQPALCTTDADCMRFGGTGAPEPLTCWNAIRTSDVLCELVTRGCW